MEKFWVLDENTALSSDYKQYLTNNVRLYKIINEFVGKWGLEIGAYNRRKDCYLSIIPTESSHEKFKSQFKAKQSCNGPFTWHTFKKTSPIGRDWAKTLVDENVQITDRPFVAFYLKSPCGHMRQQLLEYKDKVYCSFSCDTDFTAPAGFIEIKGSEFFKVVEDFNTEIEKENATEGESAP